MDMYLFLLRKYLFMRQIVSVLNALDYRKTKFHQLFTDLICRFEINVSLNKNDDAFTRWRCSGHSSL